MKNLIHEWFKKNDAIKNLKEKWSQLGAREKYLLTIGGIALIIFIIYKGVWSPILDKVNMMRLTIVTNDATLAWMKTTDETLRTLDKKLKSPVGKISTIELLSILQEKVKQLNFAAHLTQLKQVSQNTLTMQLQQVDFDIFIGLLIDIMKEHPITVTHLSVLSLPTPGVVNVELTLQLTDTL